MREDRRDVMREDGREDKRKSLLSSWRSNYAPVIKSSGRIHTMTLSELSLSSAP